jgi:diguanylate cyclase (GGDEF)-like protein
MGKGVAGNFERHLQTVVFDERRAAIVFWVGGISAVLLVIPGSHWTRHSIAAAFVGIACAVLAAVVRFVWRDHLPTWSLHIDVIIAVVLVSVVAAVEPSGDLNFAFFYVWISLFAALYFSFRMMLVHIIGTGVAYALVLFVSSPVAQPVASWTIIIGSAAILGAIVETLVSGLRSLSTEDALTHLPNRRSWADRCEEEFERARRSREPLSLASIDIDGFKDVNDREGHAAGDSLLLSFADGWRQMTRGGGDFVARLGGDEFGLLAPGSNERDAARIADRIRGVSPRGVTCSVGVATWNRVESADELLSRADEAMYRSKRARKSS